MPLSIAGRACFTANKIWKEDPMIKGGMAYHFILMLLGGYAGGILCPLLLGKPAAPLVNDAIPSIAFCVWFLFFVPGYLGLKLSAGSLYNVLPLRIAGLLLENIFKANVMVSMAILSINELSSLFGPIVITTMAGCGGVFCPLGSLAALYTGVPQGVHDAMVGALLVNFALRGDAYLALCGLELPKALDMSERVQDLRVFLAAGYFVLATYREVCIPLMAAQANSKAKVS